MKYSFDEPFYFILFIILPFVGWLAFHFIRWRNQKQKIFASSRFRDTIFGNDKRNKAYRWILPLFFVGFLSLLVAIVDIVGGGQSVDIHKKTGNVLFALDVSNSMNAEDLPPNRLTNSKNIVINTLSHFGTDRIGLIVFAGKAKSIMPLTTDYLGAESYISAIETNIIKVQGTDFLNAINAAAEKFRPIDKNGRLLVLLSDGEDNEENLDEAIKLAKKEGIIIITIGLGTEEGAPIPEYLLGQLMGYKMDSRGEMVLSKRQAQSLKELASKTGGIYIDGNDMESAVYQLSNYINKANKGGAYIKVKSENAEHYYQYPLALSFLCFIVIFLFNPRRNFNV